MLRNERKRHGFWTQRLYGERTALRHLSTLIVTFADEQLPAILSLVFEIHIVWFGFLIPMLQAVRDSRYARMEQN